MPSMRPPRTPADFYAGRVCVFAIFHNVFHSQGDNHDGAPIQPKYAFDVYDHTDADFTHLHGFIPPSLLAKHDLIVVEGRLTLDNNFDRDPRVFILIADHVKLVHVASDRATDITAPEVIPPPRSLPKAAPAGHSNDDSNNGYDEDPPTDEVDGDDGDNDDDDDDDDVPDPDSNDDAGSENMSNVVRMDAIFSA